MSDYDRDVFSKLVGVPMTKETKEYIREINQRYSLRVSDDFLSKYGDIVEYNNKDTQFISDAVIEEIKLNMDFTIGGDKERIRLLDSVPKLRDANTREQRWLQAEPTLNGLIQMEFTDGYKETRHTLSEMDKPPETRRDYRLVTSGICGLTLEDDSIGLFEDSIMTEDEVLTPSEKMNLLCSFSAIRQAIEDNVDITDEDASFL